MTSSTKCGFAAVVGKPNVGKSTLVNQLVGRKVGITSPKPQTTRKRILGVKTKGNIQIIFVDTPGLTLSRTLLGRTMLNQSKEALSDCDLALFVADASGFAPDREDRIAWRIFASEMKFRAAAPPIYLVLNKADKFKDKKELLPIIKNFSTLGTFQDVFPVSALKGENLEPLENAILKYIPESPHYFPSSEQEPQEERVRISEIIREKILFLVHQEVPHGAAAAVEEMRPGKNPETLYIKGTIFVQKESHKGILVGKDGKMLKKIGTLARKEIEFELKKPVYLDLWVKVKAEWQEREEMLRYLGYV
jgi:GTP-binding protein Era